MVGNSDICLLVRSRVGNSDIHLRVHLMEENPGIRLRVHSRVGKGYGVIGSGGEILCKSFRSSVTPNISTEKRKFLIFKACIRECSALLWSYFGVS